MNRALPGWAIDLIRDGVPARDLRSRSDGAIWHALFRTATSAYMRGIPYTEWYGVVSDAKSTLGHQARLKKGRQTRSPADYSKMLRKAWEKAAKWVDHEDRPKPYDHEETRQEGVRRAQDVLALVADPEVPLTEAERSVLAHAAEEGGTRRPNRSETYRVALPRRAIMEATGQPERAVRGAVASLLEKGLLSLVTPGRSAVKAKDRRANVYALPDAEAVAHYLSRGTRLMGQQDQGYGAAAASPAGARAKTYGAAGPQQPRKEGSSVVNYSLSASSPEELLAEARALLEREGYGTTPPPRRAEPTSPLTAGGNVRPLRPSRRRSA